MPVVDGDPDAARPARQHLRQQFLLEVVAKQGVRLTCRQPFQVGRGKRGKTLMEIIAETQPLSLPAVDRERPVQVLRRAAVAGEGVRPPRRAQ